MSMITPDNRHIMGFFVQVDGMEIKEFYKNISFSVHLDSF